MSLVQVQEFNDTFGVKTRSEAAVRVREAKLRFGLVEEEFGELLDAYEAADLTEIADALGDIRYVVLGAAQVFGLVTSTVNKYAELADTNFEFQLLVEATQKETLDVLRLAILRNRPEDTAEVLAVILKMVDDAATFFDIDLDLIVSSIHKSNMSKLAADGSVIRRETDNKVLKGENYVTPTADIEELLFGAEDVEAV